MSAISKSPFTYFVNKFNDLYINLLTVLTPSVKISP
uniref:Uncharacterized protein n=1 Tax=Siphoviridae sp. ctBrh2 TaxID=2827804 RepID=A0A8S5S859_9CAUD|nr:MAG TPA: hypothetical protein [Siphoviridae sp. ctBrh2]